MKTRYKAILLALALLLGLSAWFLRNLAAFPGQIAAPEYTPTEEAGRWAFRAGAAYRHSGFPTMAEVKGSHYDMGLQYGVLLRPEILSALDAYEKVLRRTAAEMDVPFPVLVAGLKFKAKRMARRLPARFREEIRGVSDGSGVPRDAITAVSLMYDVFMAGGCTGLLMRTEEGGVIHAHSQEPYGMGYDGLLDKHTAIVRHQAEGHNAVTHLDPVLFLGVEAGYNDQGLTYTEETYSIREPNPTGFPIVYLARLALEEAATLEEVEHVLSSFSVAAPGGMIWSDRDEAQGERVEILPTGMAVQEMEGPILWNFNNIVDPELARQQHPRASLAGFNRDREEMAAAFPEKPAYTVEDAVAFMRARHAPDGSDRTWLGAHSSIANAWGQQMMVFDPEGDGFYLALGETFASLRAVYRYRDDFSRPPEFFMEGVPLEPVVEQAALIKTSIKPEAEKLKAYIALAQEYPKDANAQFLAAYTGFLLGQWSPFNAYAQRACELAPAVPEYRLYAGLANYRMGNLRRAAELLDGICGPAGSATSPDAACLSPEQELYRLTALARVWAGSKPEWAAQCQQEIQAILERYDAEGYYDGAILPKFEALEAKP